MSDETKIEDIYQLIDDIEAQLARLKQMMGELGPVDELRAAREKAEAVGSTTGGGKDTIIEGVFDGQNMVGPDGKIYTVPANYASKSKLVEGDIMKLTITGDGSFIYKQIGPVNRRRQLGTLVQTDSGTFRAVTKKGRSFRLLTASVTYFHGEAGNKVVMLIPEEMDSKWAAVENIVKNGEELEEAMLESGVDMELEAGDDMELMSGDDMELESGADMELEAGDDMELPLGDDMELEDPLARDA